jgi:Arc/MetJ family transcription regulator
VEDVKTVQMTIDEDLIAEVDRAAAAQGKNRSAFTRDALRAALAGARVRELEERHRLGYQRQPVQPGELDDWEAEQVWPPHPLDPLPTLRGEGDAPSPPPR